MLAIMQNQRLFVLFAILAVIQLCAGQSQEPITCTAGYYRSGETAKITCHYHGDIATSRNSGAYIQRHKLDARDYSSGMEVTVCHFSGGSVSVCDPEAGYRFLSFSARNLTIDVPHVSAEFQGRYTCGLVPPPGESPRRPVHPCLLIVEEALQSGNNAQKGSGVHEGLHGHVQAILTLLIIVIIVAAALIAYTIVAYKKTWFPFRKKSEAKKPDGEKGNMLDNLNSDGTKRTPQESVANPIIRTSVIASAPPTAPELERLLEEENDRAHNSARGDEATAKGSRATETKPETEDERREREKREKEEKAAEEIRLEKVKLDDLKRSLKNAQDDDQKRIKKEIKENEKRLNNLEKAEKERKKQLQKDEEQLKKREKKERKEREKKGKKK